MTRPYVLPALNTDWKSVRLSLSSPGFVFGNNKYITIPNLPVSYLEVLYRSIGCSVWGWQWSIFIILSHILRQCHVNVRGHHSMRFGQWPRRLLNMKYLLLYNYYNIFILCPININHFTVTIIYKWNVNSPWVIFSMALGRLDTAQQNDSMVEPGK